MDLDKFQNKLDTLQESQELVGKAIFSLRCMLLEAKECQPTVKTSDEVSECKHKDPTSCAEKGSIIESIFNCFVCDEYLANARDPQGKKICIKIKYEENFESEGSEIKECEHVWMKARLPHQCEWTHMVCDSCHEEIHPG